jgi:hypothetical protein
VGLATIFYCLRFETSLFVAFYESQWYGGINSGTRLTLLIAFRHEHLENTVSIVIVQQNLDFLRAVRAEKLQAGQLVEWSELVGE